MKKSSYLSLLVFLVFSMSLMTTLFAAGSNELKNQNADILSTINSGNFGNSKVLWTAQSKYLITHKPLVDQGIVYYADWGGTVYAADAITGKILWENKIQSVDSKGAWYGFSGTGVLGDDMLFEASAEGMLYAIAKTDGQVKWKAKFTDQPVSGNTGALLYFNGMVYVPVCSMDEGMDQQKDFVTDFQGRVEAYDAKTGKNIWEFKTVTGKENGVAVWSGFALDEESKTLYFDTGNNYTGAATDMSDAIVAVDALTGKLKWMKQCLKNDVWTMAQPKGPDYDFGAAPQLFEAKIAGKEVKLIAAGQKNGTLWVLDRTTGKDVWSAQLGLGATGGGFLASSSIDKNGICAWANNAYKYADAEKHLMDIAKFDLGTGKVLWKMKEIQPAWMTQSGFVAGDVYFVGSTDGIIRGYNTKTGESVWKSEKMNSISTSIVVNGGNLYFGTGLPKMFGGTETGGIMNCIGIPVN